MLLNGIAQAAAGSYLQTAIVAVASLFGPSAMQSMMAGQAAVAVVVSGVQVIAAAVLLWGVPEDSISTFTIGNEAEERSAFVFFGLSTLFLLAATWANSWFFALPAYRTMVPLERKYEQPFGTDNLDERQGLVSNGVLDENSEKRRRILRVANANLIYEIAVAFDFIITLVRSSSLLLLCPPQNSLFSPCSPR